MLFDCVLPTLPDDSHVLLMNVFVGVVSMFKLRCNKLTLADCHEAPFEAPRGFTEAMRGHIKLHSILGDAEFAKPVVALVCCGCKASLARVISLLFTRGCCTSNSKQAN